MGFQDPRASGRFLYDIGNISSEKMTDSEKLEFMKSCWSPDSSFKFPAMTEGRNKGRKFQHDWLQSYPWLRYSKQLDGAFCLLCVLFLGKHGVGNGLHMAPSVLVKLPARNWKVKTTFFVNQKCWALVIYFIFLQNGKEMFSTHEQSNFHLKCEETARRIGQIHDNKAQTVDTLVNAQAAEGKERNRR